MNITLKNIEEELARNGYFIDKRVNALNIVGIRNNKPSSPVEFDDFIAIFYYDKDGNIKGKVSPATTDPSVNYLQNPLKGNEQIGTAILKSGQYKDSYEIGLHKGKYLALRQAKPVTVIRDNDRDAVINFFAETTTGMYYINIHRASRGKNNEAVIGLDSAGCQVFKNEKDFDEMMVLASRHRSLYGNKFTYTLIDLRDKVKYRNTTVVFVIAGIAAILIGYSLFLTNKNK